MKSTWSDAIETSDGGFLLVGSKWDNEKKVGWCVELDHNGNLIKELFYHQGSSGRRIFLTVDSKYLLVEKNELIDEVIVTKFNGYGQHVWNKKHLLKGRFADADKTYDGGLFVASCSHTSNVDYRMWVTQLNNGGHKLKEILIKEGSNPRPNNISYTHRVTSICSVKDGGCIVSGLSYAGREGVSWLVRLDQNCIIQWEKSYGASSISINRVIANKDGGFVVVGTGAQDDTRQRWNMKIMCLDSNGGTIWENDCGGLGTDQARDVIQTKDGGYFLVGYTKSAGGVGRNINGHKCMSVKFNTSGSLQWHRTFSLDQFYNLDANIRQDIWLSSISTIDEGYLIVGYAGVSRLNERHAWALKMDGNGSYQWDLLFE